MRGTGFLKLHRELYNKPIWTESTPHQKVILITLLGMANYEANSWTHEGKHYTVKKGQFITSISTIIKNCGNGITRQNVKSALKRFEKLGFITDVELTKNKNRLITINNWDIYQGKNTNPLTNRLTNDLTNTKSLESIDNTGIEHEKDYDLTNRLANVLTPIKEVKEIKNNNMSIQQAELFTSWWNLYGKKIGRKKCETQFRKLMKKYEYSVIEEGTKRYLQYLNDLGERGEFVPTKKNPLTFLNGEHFIDEYETNFVNQQLNEKNKDVTIEEFSGISLD